MIDNLKVNSCFEFLPSLFDFIKNLELLLIVVTPTGDLFISKNQVLFALS